MWQTNGRWFAVIVKMEETMEFNFYPWKLEIDVEKTRTLYDKKSFAVDEEANRILISKLTKEQRTFLDSLGVDSAKIQVHKKEYDLSEEECGEDELHSLEVAFLLCGKFLAAPADQIEMYKDEDIYGRNMVPEDLDIEIVDTDELFTSIEFGIGLRFKHPISHFEGDEYTNWECGYVCGSTIFYY